MIIDEANLVLGNKTNGTKELLARFVKNTVKQDRTTNVILSRSERAYPYKLRAEHLVDLANVVVAGELSPRKTLEFFAPAFYPDSTVVSRKKRLITELFLAAYGGHVPSIEKAAQRIALKQERFKAKRCITYHVRE